MLQAAALPKDRKTKSGNLAMIDREAARFHSPRTDAPRAALLNRRALLAGPAAILCTRALHAATPEQRSLDLPLTDPTNLRTRNVSVTAALFRGRNCAEVRLAGAYPGPDRDYFAYVPGLDMHDGTIEVELAGAPLPGAPAGARGFVGLAFRIDETGGSFACECIYIRPTNGRADDQVRRNHSTQYFSYPGYDFDRLRREAPGRYESYVDVEPAQWTKVRIELSGSRADLFVGDAAQPVLIVTDLKRGPEARGTVGLYVDNGTDGHFCNLRINPR
jgi:hypothetical protein